MSALDKINVNKLLNYIQESLASALDQFVFQPNIPSTRNDVAFVIETLIQDLHHRGTINDYKVVCDEYNNSPDAIKDNQLICDVFIRPTVIGHELYNIRAAVIGSALNLDSTVLTKQDYETRYEYAMAILGKK